MHISIVILFMQYRCQLLHLLVLQYCIALMLSEPVDNMETKHNSEFFF
jgi:hypothetical protein